MNKTQIKKFALKVQEAISMHLSELNESSLKKKVDFFALLIKEGQEFHPDAIYLIIEEAKLDDSFMKSLQHDLSPEEFAEIQAKNLLPSKKITPKLGRFEETPSMESFYEVTNYSYIENFKKMIEEQITYLVFEYEYSILENVNRQLSYSEFDIYIYTYFINKIINDFPELIVKPKEPKSSRSNILPFP
jgi:hypothetical protein